MLNISIFKNFFASKIKTLELLFYFMSVFFFTTIALFVLRLGPFYTTDTINYLEMAQKVAKGLFPNSPFLSPGYPFFVGIISKLFSTSEVNVLRLGVFIFILSAFFVFYQIVKLNYSKERRSFFYFFLLSFILFSHWAILKILLTAHADALFLVALLIYLLFLFLWLDTFKIKWFLLATIVGSLCIWIKYNGLILIPFLIISSVIFGKKRFRYYILGFPIVTALTSYYTFKAINGAVIGHFKGVFFLEKIQIAICNHELFHSNFALSGRVFISTLFTRSAEIFVPNWLGVGFMIFLVLVTFIYFVLSKNSKNVVNVFLLFSLFYWISLFTISQYIAYEEITSRTMFPSMLSFFIWLALILKSVKSPFKYLIISILCLNLIYSFFYVSVLNKSEVKNTFNYVSNFSNRKSVIELKKAKKKYNFEDRIYTNETRNLFFALDYSKIKKYPSKNEFSKGKLRNIGEVEFSKNQKIFCNNFLKSNSAVLLFDYSNLKELDSCLITKNTKVYLIDKDVLLLHLLN